MQVRNVLEFMRVHTPAHLSESWDNTGLLIGAEDRPAERVMTCLTLTPDVAAEAIDRQANLIITHHPILFRAVQQITSSTAEGAMLLGLIENQIGVFSPHTCYDSAFEGINHQLAESLGLSDIQPIRPIEEADDSPTESIGSGRFGDLASPISLRELVEVTKQALGIANTQFVGDENKTIRRVGVACGAAAEFMGDAARLGCDALLTGEARFHACLEARTLDIALILPGHYATERPAMENLAKRLNAEFNDLDVWPSAVETDPIGWA